MTTRPSSFTGDLLLIVALAAFGTGLTLGVGGLLNGIEIGVNGPLLNVPALSIAAPLAGTLGAAAVLPTAAILSLAA